jgi:hypothetical protein
MTDVRETIRQALLDAIGWQESLAACYARDQPEWRECKAQARKYRKIMKRRYGTDLTPLETAMKDARPIGLDELRKLPEQGP